MDAETGPAACAEGGEDGFGSVVETILAGRVVPAFWEEAGDMLLLETLWSWMKGTGFVLPFGLGEDGRVAVETVALGRGYCAWWEIETSYVCSSGRDSTGEHPGRCAVQSQTTAGQQKSRRG